MPDQGTLFHRITHPFQNKQEQQHSPHNNAYADCGTNACDSRSNLSRAIANSVPAANLQQTTTIGGDVNSAITNVVTSFGTAANQGATTATSGLTKSATAGQQFKDTGDFLLMDGVNVRVDSLGRISATMTLTEKEANGAAIKNAFNGTTPDGTFRQPGIDVAVDNRTANVDYDHNKVHMWESKAGAQDLYHVTAASNVDSITITIPGRDKPITLSREQILQAKENALGQEVARKEAEKKAKEAADGAQQAANKNDNKGVPETTKKPDDGSPPEPQSPTPSSPQVPAESTSSLETKPAEKVESEKPATQTTTPPAVDSTPSPSDKPTFPSSPPVNLEGRENLGASTISLQPRNLSFSPQSPNIQPQPATILPAPLDPTNEARKLARMVNLAGRDHLDLDNALKLTKQLADEGSLKEVLNTQINGKTLKEIWYENAKKAGKMPEAIQAIEGEEAANAAKAIYDRAYGLTDRAALENIVQMYAQDSEIFGKIQRVWDLFYKELYGGSWNDMLAYEQVSVTTATPPPTINLGAAEDYEREAELLHTALEVTDKTYGEYSTNSLADLDKAKAIISNAKHHNSYDALNSAFEIKHELSVSDYLYQQAGITGQLESAIDTLEDPAVASGAKAIYQEASRWRITGNKLLIDLLEANTSNLPEIKKVWDRTYKKSSYYNSDFDAMLDSELGSATSAKYKDAANTPG